jgi:hypothetical protein
VPRSIPADELEQIEKAVRASPGITSAEIASVLRDQVPRRTLQFRLKRLVDDGRILREGDGRWARYSAPGTAPSPQPEAAADEAAVPLSSESQEIWAYLRQPLAARKPVGYDREFLDAYRPGETFYLPEGARARLAEIGARPVSRQEPAGTYARQILNRLLIDLSWNSSRLEGNTYSLLDTKRLIEFGQEAEGRGRLEAQMILNHKDAVEFLVRNAAEIGFNRYTILNLHAILANNLLVDESAAGRLRHIGGWHRRIRLPSA